MVKNIIILFGEMGGGKNYWGEKIAQEKRYTFYDGDRAAPPEVIEKVTQFIVLSRNDIQYLVDCLYKSILSEAQSAEGLVVAQALYFDEDRIYLMNALAQHGYQITFHWIKPPFWRNIKQIYSRPNGWKWVVYWLKNKRWFEKPSHEYELVK